MSNKDQPNGKVDGAQGRPSAPQGSMTSGQFEQYQKDYQANKPSK